MTEEEARPVNLSGNCDQGLSHPGKPARGEGQVALEVIRDDPLREIRMGYEKNPMLRFYRVMIWLVPAGLLIPSFIGWGKFGISAMILVPCDLLALAGISWFYGIMGGKQPPDPDEVWDRGCRFFFFQLFGLPSVGFLLFVVLILILSWYIE